VVVEALPLMLEPQEAAVREEVAQARLLVLPVLARQTPAVVVEAQSAQEQLQVEQAAQASSSSECPTTSVQPSLVA
jgi:hypothetical protein